MCKWILTYCSCESKKTMSVSSGRSTPGMGLLVIPAIPNLLPCSIWHPTVCVCVRLCVIHTHLSAEKKILSYSTKNSRWSRVDKVSPQLYSAVPIPQVVNCNTPRRGKHNSTFLDQPVCPRQGWLIEFSLAWYCLTSLVWSVSQIICAICVLKLSCNSRTPFWNMQFCSFHFKWTIRIGWDFIQYHKRHFRFFSKCIFRSDWRCETSNHPFHHLLFLFYSPVAPP